MRDIQRGSGCVGEVIVIAGYYLVAWLLGTGRWHLRRSCLRASRYCVPLLKPDWIAGDLALNWTAR